MIERQITPEEKAYILGVFSRSYSSFIKFTGCLNKLVIGFSASLFFSVMFWIGLAWLYSFFSDHSVGFTSQYQKPVFILLISICGVYAVYSCLQWFQEFNQEYNDLLSEVRSATVNQWQYDILAVKQFVSRLQQRIIYFLLISENRVFAISHDLREDPQYALFERDFQLKRNIQLVQLPIAKFNVKIEFSGDPLDQIDSFEMNRALEGWSNYTGFVEVEWNEIERYFAKTN